MPVEAQPRVSCLMVTANRKEIAKRSVACFKKQSYPNKELVILDDGTQDYTPILAGIPTEDVLYHKISKKEGQHLGQLRNISLDIARGDVMAQWDDDDWYHPNRLTIQVSQLNDSVQACTLSKTMMHVNSDEYREFPFLGGLKGGVPGTIVHYRNDDIRYPNIRKAEDTDYLHEWMKLGYTKLADEYAYLFLRAFHGSNTWDMDHFTRRMRNSPIKLLRYLWFKHVIKDLSLLPELRLDDKAKEAFLAYMADSEYLFSADNLVKT